MAPPLTAAPALPWFAWYSAHGRERTAEKALEDAGFTAYLPLETVTVRHARRVEAAERPLFHRYGFVQLDLLSSAAWTAARHAKGVEALLGAGSTPTPVPAATVHELAVAQHAGLLVRKPPAPEPPITLGDNVHVIVGPFATSQFVAKVLRANPGSERVQILLGEMRMWIPRLHVERVR